MYFLGHTINGLVGYLLRAPEYTRLYDIAFEPVPGPGPEPVAPREADYERRLARFRVATQLYATEHSAWIARKKTYSDTEALVRACRSGLVACLSGTGKKLLSSPTNMFLNLRDALALLDTTFFLHIIGDIYELIGALQIPCAEPFDAAAHLVDFNTTCDKLRVENKEPDDFNKLLYYRKSAGAVQWVAELDERFQTDVPPRLQTFPEFTRRVTSAFTRRPALSTVAITSGSGLYANAANVAPKTYTYESRFGTKTWDKAAVLKRSKSNPEHKLYCHKHGTHCNHDSRGCEQGKLEPATHKPDATLANQMGGKSTPHVTLVMKRAQAIIKENRSDFP